MTKNNDDELNTEKSKSIFVGFVLLKNAELDFHFLQDTLLKDWNIKMEDSDKTDDTIVFDTDSMTVGVTLVKGKVPNDEAETNAQNNYMWSDAVEITKSHNAQIIVSVLGKNETAIEAGKLYVKISSSLLKQKEAIAIYTSGTVFEPSFYINAANSIKENSLPILNWIYFGLYRGATGINGYTYGLKMFNKSEIEILESTMNADKLYNSLIDITYYILNGDINLKDGETIGFSEEEKFKITHSKGVSLEGTTIKITM